MSKPFSRVLAMMTLIQIALSKPFAEIPQAMAAIGPYESRGKAPRGSKRYSRTNFDNTRSKYMPHQGKQEMARRAAA